MEDSNSKVDNSEKTNTSEMYNPCIANTQVSNSNLALRLSMSKSISFTKLIELLYDYYNSRDKLTSFIKYSFPKLQSSKINNEIDTHYVSKVDESGTILNGEDFAKAFLIIYSNLSNLCSDAEKRLHIFRSLGSRELDVVGEYGADKIYLDNILSVHIGKLNYIELYNRNIKSSNGLLYSRNGSYELHDLNEAIDSILSDMMSEDTEVGYALLNARKTTCNIPGALNSELLSTPVSVYLLSYYIPYVKDEIPIICRLASKQIDL